MGWERGSGKGEAGGFRYKVKQKVLHESLLISGLVVRITDLHKMAKYILYYHNHIFYS